MPIKHQIMILMDTQSKVNERKEDIQTKIALLEAWIKAEEQIVEKLVEIAHFILGELDGIYSQKEILPFNVNNRELLFELIGKYMSMCANMSEKLTAIQIGNTILDT
ncbi:hypothetical protein [Candidatus Borrarchaeum sp.]|uniref:hypothetical protein n=1 Tax=Candidatus Borrarchaeum sp. TaxID=2846742 RepID=UPI0025803BBB|nr:hypothetical protein [Candidatus Borrarchaeum sp.]